MIHEHDPLTWPASRLGEALQALAWKSRMVPRSVEAPAPPTGLAKAGVEALGRWLEGAAGRLDLEAEPAEPAYPAVERFVQGAGPLLLCLPDGGERRFLAILRGSRRAVSVLGPDLVLHRLRPEFVRAALCREVEAPLLEKVDRLLDEAGVPDRRRARARAAILGERLREKRIDGVWQLRPSPGANVWTQVRHARLPRRLLVFLAAFAVQYVLWLVSWGLVGRGALQGRFEPGWLLAWALLLLTLVPLRLLVTWAEGQLAITAGSLLKQRLLHGALRLEPDEIRHQGVGQLLGRVIESEAVEALALSGGFLALLAAIEIAVTTAVLAAGAGGGLHTLLLLGWVTLLGLIGWRYYRHRSHWTETRLRMTHDLVEGMVGHRTRLAQEGRERWHEGEDRALARYLERSRVMDRVMVYLLTFEDGWLVLGLLGLVPAFVSGDVSTEKLAIGLGGVLLAYQALRKLDRGLRHLLDAAIAWRQVAPLFHAAARPGSAGTTARVSCPGSDGSGGSAQPLLDARDLVFRYHDRGEPILRHCGLRVYPGDRLLLEGPSGSGKSTLASLLTGLRQPESGRLLIHGLDRGVLGSEAWRRQVVAAPQFHENHVLTATVAFNLLMGRRWPPRRADVVAAEAVCRDLGLGDLLDRMPAGLLQLVGESGWQLSHGEKSRLYIARALLQGAELVVLDESFAALDPETLHHTLRCVLDRAPTLLVITHP
jgi:ATP-binding cassette subfamily B protein